MDDANAAVARAIRDELVQLGLLRGDRSASLEKSISNGSVTGEQWALEIELAMDADKKHVHNETR